ncbi:MAG: AmmeMemoRadiSam system protein A [Bacillota bacterium]
MADLIYTALVPHPPILIPAVGGEESERVHTTRDSLLRLAAELRDAAPEVVVIISPHGPVFSDAIAIHRLDAISGDLSEYGAPDLTFSVEIDQRLGDLLVAEAGDARIPVAPVTSEWAAEWEAERLDHGTMVPLYFLREAGWTGPVLPIAVGMLPPVQLYAFGQALQRAIDRSGRRTAVLASGDLSHRLSEEGPDGFSPDGAQFDRAVVEALGRGDLAALFAIDPDLRERAGECGYRPLLMLAGVLDGLKVKPLVYSYEHPFGVGYSVAALEPAGPDPTRQIRSELERVRTERIHQRREAAHSVARLARAALEHYVKTGLEIDFSAGAPHEGTAPWVLPDDLPDQAGVFVTLTVDGDLRGCMGSTGPTEPSLALEIVRNAIQAGVQDPRFSPVEEEELPYLEYKVDLLEEPEPATLEQLDPRVYGVVVQKGEEFGLLLPDLPGIATAEQQVAIACRKAGLEPEEPGIELYRFRVRRFL